MIRERVQMQVQMIISEKKSQIIGRFKQLKTVYGNLQTRKSLGKNTATAGHQGIHLASKIGGYENVC